MSKNLIENIQLLPKYAQITLADAALYFSGEAAIATDERKNILLNDINLMKNLINSLEQSLSSGNNQ